MKFFLLETLPGGPRHGDDVIAAPERKSGGLYRPSPGSVFPTLQLLEEGGNVTGSEVNAKRVYTLPTILARLSASARWPNGKRRP